MNESFGNWVRQKRKNLGLSQSELAARIACSAETIKKIESHRRRPSRQIAELLMHALQIEPDEHGRFMWLARGMENRPSAPFAASLQITNLDQLSPMTSLVGRDQQAFEIQEMLRRPDVCLLTLTGFAGVGKTRLALQAGRLVRDAFPDGVYLLPLANINAPESVVPAIAGFFEVSGTGEKTLTANLIDALQGKQILMVFDNFEHILGASDRAATLLEALPEFKIMATSRARLNLSGEYEYVVPPLDLPDEKERLADADIRLAALSPAINLFVQRVSAIQPGFELTRENIQLVVEICALLDGIPLAIELAAARCKVLGPHELFERMRRSSILNLLTQGAKNYPARQQNIRRAFDWSYNLLGKDEQRLFEQVGALGKEVSLETIEAAFEKSPIPVLDTLTNLVNWNMVWRKETPSTSPHFKMPTILREYAIERLAARKTAPSER